MREPRNVKTGILHLVTCRVVNDERLLAPPEAKDLFVEDLGRLREKYGGLVVDFSVLDDHVHLLFEPRGSADLAENMRWLFGVFAMRYNRRYGSSGHLWGRRYDSRPIRGGAELLEAIERIDDNAVRAGLAERPEDWEWSGLGQRRRGDGGVLGEPPPWLGLIASAHRARAPISS